MPRRPALAPTLLVVGLVAVRVLAIVVVLHSGVDGTDSILGGDARRYDVILTSPGTPYRDFPVEYPPVALGFTALVQADDIYGTEVALALSQLALELAVAGLLAWAWGRRTGIAYLVLGTPMAFFPFPYFRIDLVSVFLAVLGLALVRKRWPRAGGIALGISLLAKVWPVVALPALAVQRRWRALAAAVATGAVGLVAWVVWAGTDGPRQVVTFRGADGWQTESLVGVVLHLLDPTGSVVEQGAWRTAAAVPSWARLALPALAIATATAAWLLVERRRRQGDAEVELLTDGWAPLAGILGLLVSSSIISPQYLLWATPFVAVLAARTARGGRLVGGLFLGVAALSTAGLAAIHALIEGARWAGALVIGRNALLVAMLVVCFARLAVTRPGPVGAAPAGEAALGAAGDLPATAR